MSKDNKEYWQRIKQNKTHYLYVCLNCHKSIEHRKYTFCPYCGLRKVTDVLLNERGKVI